MIKFEPCVNCCEGYIYNNDSVTICNCLTKWREQFKIENSLIRSGINIKDWNYDISNYIGQDVNQNIIKLKKYINDFDIKFKNINLYLWSKLNSTQKTTLAKWIGINLIKKSKEVYFISMNDLVESITKVIMTDEIKEFNNKLLNSDVLIIDDVFDRNKAKPYSTGFQISYLDSFLRKRLEQIYKATIFTSNLNVEEIDNVWGISIQELVKRNVEVMEFNDHIDGKNYMTEFTKSIWD
jgi:DNA replication protein DnaC